MSWNDVSRMLLSIAREYAKRWACQLPVAGTLPEPDDEAAIEAALAAFLKDPASPFLPPAPLRPWILVRLGCAAACADQLARDGEIPPEATPVQLAGSLLIDLWKSDLKFRWHEMADDVRFGEN